MTDDFKEPLSVDRSGRDEMDDILGGASDFLKEDRESTKLPVQEKPSHDTAKPSQEEEELSLLGNDYPPEYIKMAERIRIQYELLPTLDYENIDKEIRELSIKSTPTPTLQVLNDELHKIQAAKDRLSEILMDVIKCYNFKNRAVDILRDAWGRFTAEKNTEGRKGDATFRLSNFMIDFARVEALSKSCNHVLKNLDSLHDNLSRRITVWQLLLKLRDIGRGGLPDYNFDKISEGDINSLFNDANNSVNNNENNGEEKGGSAAKLQEF